MSFGKNLQFLRHLKGNMTQEDLAEKMNISRQTVSKWELDAAQPECDTLGKSQPMTRGLSTPQPRAMENTLSIASPSGSELITACFI